ncbi:hypothetical protein, partial [Aeromonas dhakensis]|uniref:hypothetical protein n=1 Tax=Aeromonas dhakensis TaxID=196024 RepID=UPI0039A1F57D
MRSSWHKGKEAQGKARAGTTAPDCTEKCLAKKVSGFGDKGGVKGEKAICEWHFAIQLGLFSHFAPISCHRRLA